jgi:HD-GYP domain-containing protein (c-di-GMP phosphodiesterase class II)
VVRAGDPIGRLIGVLRRHDPSLPGHAVRVRRYASRLANALGLCRRLRRRIARAALLHDIGKVALPADILCKPGPLTPDELALVRRHPELGEALLTPWIPDVAVLAAVRSHHERFDGAGYPDGLRGSAIPFAARVVAVADAFDAMTSTRPYHAAATVAEAVDVLRRESHGQFDPALVERFVQLVEVAERRCERVTA